MIAIAMMIEIRTHIKRLFLGLLVFVMLVAPTAPHAQSNGPVLIRDTEIEAIFKGWAEPLLEQANMKPGSINILFVQSPQTNAFVAGGANVFFYTGLIERTDHPGELLGVLAHELGHIAGGHLIKGRDAIERASYESILGTVLGIGAALLSGNGGAANAVISGSQTYAQRKYLAHSRVYESSADQAAFSYMDGAGINPSGLSSFFNKLKSQEFLPSSRQDEYVRTHPITANRIEAMNARIAKSEFKDAPLPAPWMEQHARMKAKLVGFISPGQVVWTYDDRDHSIPARYARAIAAYRQNLIPEALEKIDALIADEPDNPYFHELKGQMLVDFSRIEEALPPYKRSVELLPEAPLLRMALAHALIESGSDEGRLNEAISHLKRALEKETSSARAHRLLATAYGRLGQDNLTKLHLAEEAVLQRRLPYAKSQAQKVLDQSKPGGRTWLKAKDVLTHIETLEKLQG